LQSANKGEGVVSVVKRYIYGRPDPGEHWVGERYVLASDFDGVAAELAECRNNRQREHDLRVTIAGELESFKIRYQDEVNARVNAENELDAVRSGFVAELRKAKAALATARIAHAYPVKTHTD
jgi:hypothetical protein